MFERGRNVTRGILLFGITAFPLPAAMTAETPTLVRNGTFAQVDTDGRPAEWRIDVGDGRLRLDTREHPDGVACSVRVDVGSAASGDGQLVQRIRGLAPGRLHALRATIKSTAPRVGYLQVKLYRDGHETQRISSEGISGDTWQPAEVRFSTGDADFIEVLCRFRRKAAFTGESIWFADVVLEQAAPPRFGEAVAVTTFNSIGIRIPYTGGLTAESACRLRFRTAGAGEDAWRDGMDLFDCPRERELRGSLLLLAPDTAYELECRLIDSTFKGDGPLDACRLTARTWAENVPVASVREVASPPGGGGMWTVGERGTPDAWVLYRPARGFDGVVDGGTNNAHALRFEQAAYVIVEGFTFRGGCEDCVRVSDSHDVRIRRCDIAGWGDPGTWRVTGDSGRYVDARGRVINYQAGIRVRDGSTRIVIERNFIHAPRGTANAWQYGHPAGPQGVILDRTGGNNVVRDNDIVGSEAHWWNDAIESIRNGDVDGGPYRDTDIHGNLLAFCNDDGTELDGGQINVRYWHNWIDKVLCGVSCAPNVSGPSYVFRNLIAGLGEEREAAGSAFKMGGGASASPGMNVILHNTIVGPGGGLRSVGFGASGDRGAYIAYSRNNLFAGSGHDDLFNTSTDPRNDFDYDLAGRGGIHLASGGETHAVTSTPIFVDAPRGDYRLAAGSPGVDQGCRLPGVNDAFSGAAPDMGAFEGGAAAATGLPPRRDALDLSPARVTLDVPAGGSASGAELRLRVPSAMASSWRAIPNSPWVSCEPAAGTAADGEQCVRVCVAERLALRRHRGAVTIRTDTGLCRTAMVTVRVMPASPFTLRVEAEAGALSGGLRVASMASASGGAFVHLPGEAGNEKGSVAYAFEVPAAGRYYVAARCGCPAQDAGLHDSYYVAMDGGDRVQFGLPFREAPAWRWISLPGAYELEAGRHLLRFDSRESLSRLDCVVVTNNPYPEDLPR